MTDIQSIQARSSRRAYTGHMTPEQCHKMEGFISKVNLDSHLDISLLRDGNAVFGGITHSYGLFTGAHSLLVLAGPQADEHLREKAGYAGQRLVLDATKMGLGTCWVGGTFNREKLAGSLPARQVLVAVITLGQVKDSKGLIEKTVSRVASGKRLAAAQMMEGDGDAPEWFLRGVEAAVLAPSAMNRQPVRFKYENGTATAHVPAPDEGFQAVDLGIAKLHFEIAAGGHFALGNGGAFTPAE